MLKFAFGTLVAGTLIAAAGPALAQRHEISNDMGKCASGSSGPAVLVNVTGFESNSGNIRVQSYPATKAAWLEKGRWINRIQTPVRVSGKYMQFCMPVPRAGNYGIAVRHDVNANGKTDISRDGGGMSNNPSINIFNLGKPSVNKVSFYAGSGVTSITINLKYL